MNKNNNKSPNKNKLNFKNNKKNTNLLDLSFNFHRIFDNSLNYLNDKKNPLHNDLEKTIDELIDDMCRDFDEILKITSMKTKLLDQSYNQLLLEDKKRNSFYNFKDNKSNYTNSFIMNDKNKVKLHTYKNKSDFSYYLNSFNKPKPVKTKNDITSTLAHINRSYNDLTIKKYNYNKKKIPIPTPIKIKKRKVTIDVTLNSIGDLINLAEKYPLSSEVEYNIDMKAIHLIQPDIVRLNEMIGMHNLKENILDQIIYFIQKLHIHKNKDVNNEFMHTVIYGPPGTGKTETAHIIGGIYSKLGILKKNVFKKVTRADLIAGYLGQTALKTQEVIKSAIGGVLFIDEAYALGNKEQKDSFAKECIDTLCEALSNHKHELMVIIAGYEDDLKRCFFSYNQGLDSRFIWRFKIDDYNSKELQQIFNKKVKDCGWTIGKTPTSWFEKNKDYFKFFGRDMETLLSKVKIAHSRRVFCLPEKEKRNINKTDIENGFKLYLKNDEVKSRAEESRNILVNMYI